MTRVELFGIVQRLSQSERKWMIRKWRTAKHKHKITLVTKWSDLTKVTFTFTFTSAEIRKWNPLILKPLSCHLRRRLWPIFRCLGWAASVMLQNQLHPPFFSLYCFFWILIVLFDRYGRVNIWRNWNSSIIEELKWIASGRCVFDFMKILIIILEDNSSFMFWRHGNKWLSVK